MPSPMSRAHRRKSHPPHLCPPLLCHPVQPMCGHQGFVRRLSMRSESRRLSGPATPGAGKVSGVAQGTADADAGSRAGALSGDDGESQECGGKDARGRSSFTPRNAPLTRMTDTLTFQAHTDIQT